MSNLPAAPAAPLTGGFAILAARRADGHAHVWRTVSGSTVDRGATYCAWCQIDR